MLAAFDPLVRQWFSGRFHAATEPQLRGWAEIAAGRDALICAPTGSGKTLAAFLFCLDTLVRAARNNTLADETYAVYVSPLKALSNDVHKNLEIPLKEIADLAERQQIPLAPIRTAVRTGDTPAWERQQMGRKPPHILVTTPESLYSLLTAERSRRMLRSAHTLIIDEIHAVAGNKRGSHLALSIARLEALAKRRPLRIGLSATVKPVEEIGRFLGPGTHIIDIGHKRAMDLAVEAPRDELAPVASNETWAELYDRIANLILSHRTTLVFVNTRRLSERVAHALGERIGEDQVIAHHGSLARQTRLKAESRLKSGELRAVVATASLELGIDIGTVDLVCQIGSTRSIAVALQRIGRGGHWVGAMTKGRIFATTRDELIECDALVSAIRKGDLERIAVPQNALDILAQQIVAAASAEPWEEDKLFETFRSAYPYRALPRADFDAVLHMLSEGIATSRGRSGAFLHRDRINGRIKGRRGARLAAITSGGAIPDNANYAVIAEPDGKSVGALDEDFAVESMAGDIFLLGTHSWRIKRIESGRVRVEDAKGAPPTVPFWFGEAPGRSAELSAEVSRLREEILERGESAREFLMSECALDEAGARQAAAYIQSAAAALGALPSQTTVVAERFFDEAGGMQLVLHAPFGSRVNRAWGLALRKRFCRTFNFELQAAATDNGIVISLSEQHAFPLELVFEFLRPDTLEDVLTQALLPVPVFTARWRWNASRALAIPRFAGGRKIPPPIQRMRSDDLLAAVFPDQVACAENLSGPIRIPDHPLVKETIGNCLHEAMDIDALGRIIAAIRNGSIRTATVETTQASPLSHEILNANPYAFLDDAPLEERRTRAVQMRGTLGADFSGGAGILDGAAIVEASRDAWPTVRDADELHDALLTLIALPPAAEWKHWFDELAASGRASTIAREGKTFWIATERLHLASDAVATLRGWMESTGPITAPALAEKLALPIAEIQQALARLEAEGQILQGRFTTVKGGVEWCNRRILARIHRLTLGRLRREIEPVTALQFHHFLARWQHAAPGTQLQGVEGALQIVRQLQGYEIPASAWESEILPRRIQSYDPEFIDTLCLSGEVMWGRVSPHPAIEGEGSRPVRATRIAPITFFLREDAPWLMEAATPEPVNLSHPAREVFTALRQFGACFFADLVRGAHRLPSEVEDALWELVAGGLVTADGFENLRALIDPKRRRGEGRGRLARPRHAAGRWAVLRHVPGALTRPQREESAARQLLLRWGVVFRDLLTRETIAPPWRDLLPVLRRMEAQGTIRGGRFVDGFTGEQFARPEALDLLRKIRREQPDTLSVLEPAPADPLNLTGILLPGPRISAVAMSARPAPQRTEPTLTPTPAPPMSE
ncbi:MAG: DEAD/DEAH box helicase [Bryobacterales bacterium]|nr:DEAD/DEAH box helicase [Bryobacterales bacterium]